MRKLRMIARLQVRKGRGRKVTAVEAKYFLSSSRVFGTFAQG